MKLPVNLSVNMSWNRTIDANRFFELMPYMAQNFSFGKRGPRYVMYNLSCKPGPYKRIFYTAERGKPNMDKCDWALTFAYDEELRNPRHFRFPNYARVGAGTDLIKTPTNVENELRRRKKFCAFIYSNSKTPVRNAFFDKLSKYRRVDAPGAAKNNMARLTRHKRDKHLTKYREKINFLKKYKFCIAFENAQEPGYTTEKLYHAMKAGCIPIYWGNPLVHRDFNVKSFVYNQTNHTKVGPMLDSLVDRIIQIDKDPDLYAKMVAQPWYPGNQLTKYTDPERIVANFRKIFLG